MTNNNGGYGRIRRSVSVLVIAGQEQSARDTIVEAVNAAMSASDYTPEKGAKIAVQTAANITAETMRERAPQYRALKKWVNIPLI
jgi:hypothetical protein